MSVTLHLEPDIGLRDSIAASHRHSAHTTASTAGLELAASVVWRRWLAAHTRLSARSELGDW